MEDFNFYSRFSCSFLRVGKRKVQLFLFLCLMFVGLPVYGQNTYYVSTSGTDNPTSGSSTAPFKTIRYAATKAAAGDVILVNPGTYEESNITPANSGNSTYGIYFKPSGAKGSVTIIRGAGDSPIFNLHSKSYIWIEGFIFKTSVVGSSYLINLERGTHNVILNNEFLSINMTNNPIIRMTRSENNVIRNNLFDGLKGDGANIAFLHSTDYFNLMSENSFTNNTRSIFQCHTTYPENGTKADSDNVYAFNFAEGTGGQLVYFDRNGSGSIIMRNEVFGISNLFFNESRCVRNWVYENIVANTGSWAIEDASYNTGHTEDARYINNVIYNCGHGFRIDKSWREEVRNNIVYNDNKTGSFACSFANFALDQGPHIFKNNLWFVKNANNPGPFEYGINPDRNTVKAHPDRARVNYQTFAGYIGETGGITEAPNFVDAANSDRTKRNYNLTDGSEGKGKGDSGLDLGAYPVYSKIPVGYNKDLPVTGDIVVSFDSSPVSPSSGKNKIGQAVKRGTSHTLTLTLNKRQSKETTVKILPVGGDAQQGVDFEIVGGNTITFPANQKTMRVTIDVKGYSDYDQVVALRLDNAVNADIGGMNLHIIRIERTANAGIDELKVLAPNATTYQYIPAPEVSNASAGSTYDWYTEAGELLASGLTPTLNLGKGVHRLFLKVTTPDNKTYADDVVITVVKKVDIWMEAECGILGDDWQIMTDTRASGGKYLTTDKETSGSSAATSGPKALTYVFHVEEEGWYDLWVRVNHFDNSHDSYFEGVKGNIALPKDWDLGATGSRWEWKKKTGAYYLYAGTNTLWMSQRGGGANLDKILFSNAGTDPKITGEKGTGTGDHNLGADADNCGAWLADLVVSKGTLTPAFSPDITNYTISVENNVDEIEINAFANNSRATTVTGNGRKQLAPGPNKFDIVVSADGESKTYTVTVMRLNIAYKPTTVALDFEANNIGDNYLFNTSGATRFTAKVVTDPYPDDIGNERNQVLHVSDPGTGTETNQIFPYVRFNLPEGLTLGDCDNLIFDMRSPGDGGVRLVISTEETPETTHTNNATRYDNKYGNFTSVGLTVNQWSTVTLDLSKLELSDAHKSLTAFWLGIGPRRSPPFWIDNITLDYSSAVLSNDATLSNLTVSSGVLTPAFNPNVIDYTVTLGKDAANITFGATPNYSGATVSGDGEKTLTEGANTFYINVFAEDGTTKTYTITVSNSEPVGIPETMDDKILLSVYPNPVSDILTVKVANPKAQISLYDNFGRRLLNFTANQNIETIDMRNYSTGIYYLQVFNDGTQVESKKIIKK